MLLGQEPAHEILRDLGSGAAELAIPSPRRSHGFDVAYVLSEDDIGLPPGEYGWPRFAERLGVEPVMAPGSHEACFTRPVELAEVFMKA